MLKCQMLCTSSSMTHTLCTVQESKDLFCCVQMVVIHTNKLVILAGGFVCETFSGVPHTFIIIPHNSPQQKQQCNYSVVVLVFIPVHFNRGFK